MKRVENLCGWGGLLLVLCCLIQAGCGRGLGETSSSPSGWPCSWPILAEDKFPNEEVNVMAIQELLNWQTEAGLLVNGKFNQLTTAAVKNFQLANGLSPDGKVGPQTWQLLVTDIPGQRGVNGHGGPVRALQQQLVYWGFLAASQTSGQWDATTQAAVLAFQKNRTVSPAPPSDPEAAVDLQTWQLLVSGCDASLGHQAYGIDLGWPEGNVSLAQFQCLRGLGFSFLIQEAYTESRGFWLPAVANARQALAAGFAQVEFYHFFNQSQDPASQVATTIKSLRSYNLTVSRLWVDIEGSWPASQQSNQQFLSSAIAAIQSLQVAPAIYVGRDWTSYFGANFTAFANLPLWTALYDNIPSQRFYWDNPWGGWTFPTIKQFSADGSSTQLAPTHCNVTIDWDFAPQFIQPHNPVPIPAYQ